MLKKIQSKIHAKIKEKKITALYVQKSAKYEHAVAYSRLNTYSLAASCINTNSNVGKKINLILPGLPPNGVFAGIKTALEFTSRLSLNLSLDVRIITFGIFPDEQSKGWIANNLFPNISVEFVSDYDIVNLSVNPDDIWIATYWTTAHSLTVAAHLGIIKPQNVVYLIQDHESGFHPWSTAFALTEETYLIGFHHIVNSYPLFNALKKANIPCSEELVFFPEIDLHMLKKSCADRKSSKKIRILFYGRPSKPRNLFDIGIGALTLLAKKIDVTDYELEVVSAGEKHEDIVLSDKVTLRSLGKLSWEGYFNKLGETDIVFSLQCSPHPSHPPLDAITSGAYAVTNDLNGTRQGLHPRMYVAVASPDKLADKLFCAIQDVHENGCYEYDETLVQSYGRPMNDVITTISRCIVN
ncbi:MULTISPECIES: hypothetical protein [Brenneria]|uniref:Glycosyl transferase family 1 domain-containing protein n=1 Tax=Brenneria nigrifluens DSM 30175 = ATCC 13028 TaxID=1121120 RepID=A0ABX5V582_9GAMM|nr:MULTISPECIES: hypothetical protein [Brenneria]EHD22410.1 lipopolysaccharide biosynthesis protein-like protein [Brenneria sp. EniD312]QCR05412.1 hypothetical protein EH206_15200 [Brenneria nigrifluens DSM 30175 = ATCC 13028]